MTVIIDYEAGNLCSVQRACAEVGLPARIVADPDVVRRAERIIFPGVGAAGAAMGSLKARGLDDALKEALSYGVPFLGICLGMQISLEQSEENDQPTLGLIEGRVARFAFDNPRLKIPHMGWNEVRVQQPHPVLAGIEAGDEFYFVHAYYPRPAQDDTVYAVAEYDGDFACALGKNNFFGTQFHPEKSGRVGLRLLSNFAHWKI